MTKLRSNLPLRIAGLAAGLVLAASFLASWRIQPAEGALGADVRLLTIVPGELQAQPKGAFVSARGLRPGGAPGRGSLLLRNITPRPVDVSFRPSASDRSLGARLELAAGGRVAARGSLTELEGSLRIPANSVRRLDARVWVPRGARRGAWAARFADVNLELSVRYPGKDR